MKRGDALLDASFWIALRDPREPWHTRARARVQELLAQRVRFIFTAFILAETHAYFSRSPRIRTEILDDAEHNPVMLHEPVSTADQAGAIQLLRQQADKSYSFCDALSFCIMQRLGLTRVATFDAHFRQFGGLQIIE